MSTPGLVLRDIHLPPPPPWWPPALGWWLLAAIVALAAVWLLRRWRRRLRLRRQRELLLREWQRTLDLHPPQREPAALVAALSLLLRRAARLHASQAVTLQGDSWLAFLDGDDRAQPFRTGPGRLLLDGPYRPDVGVEEARAVAELVRARLARFVAVPRA